MAYQRWWKTIRDQQGNAVNGANCAVYNGGTGTLATVYDPNTDDSAPGGLSNPFTTTANGIFGFMAADGEYDVVIAGGALATQQYRILFESGPLSSGNPGLTTFAGDGSIVFDGASGQDVTTTFIGDQIFETYGPPISQVVTTTFNPDGSITES